MKQQRKKKTTIAAVVAVLGASTALSVTLPITASAADIGQTQFGTTASEQPLAVKKGTATGKFYTKDAVLYGPDGNQFIPQGINLGVKGSVDWGGLQEDITKNNTWGSGVAPGRSGSAQEWGFNTVRLNLLTTDLYSYGQVATSGYASMMTYTDNVVKEYTSKGIVVLLESHDSIILTDKTRQAQVQSQVERFYRDAAAKYKDNPLVWFGTPNEPNVTNQAWVDLSDRYVRAVRLTGNDTIVTVNVPTWGQDLGGSSNFPGAKYSYAADMMPKLQTTAYPSNVEGTTITGNLVTEQHNYGGSCDAPKYPSAAAIKGYADKVAGGSGVVNGGTPLLFGEFGYDARNDKPIDPPNPADIWGGTAWTTWTCSFDPEKKASNATLNAAKANGVGLLFWHGTHGGDGRSLKKSYHPFWSDGGSGLGLSAQGSHLWNLTHEPTLKVTNSMKNGKGSLTVVVGDARGEATNVASGGVKRVAFLVDGVQVESKAANGDTTATVEHNLSLTPGAHSVTVAAYDTAGNVKSETMNVDVIDETYLGYVTSVTATTFGAKVPALPAGGKMSISWMRNGTRQSTTTTGTYWWSGTQNGWNEVIVKVYDGTGKLVSESAPYIR